MALALSPAVLRAAVHARLAQEASAASPDSASSVSASHPSLLGPSLAILGGNGLDVASTLGALHRGATEANPVVRGKALVPAKLMATAAELWIAHELASHGHPTAAKVLGYGIGGGLGAVGAHNLMVQQ